MHRGFISHEGFVPRLELFPHRPAWEIASFVKKSSKIINCRNARHLSHWSCGMVSREWLYARLPVKNQNTTERHCRLRVFKLCYNLYVFGITKVYGVSSHRLLSYYVWDVCHYNCVVLILKNMGGKDDGWFRTAENLLRFLVDHSLSPINFCWCDGRLRLGIFYPCFYRYF